MASCDVCHSYNDCDGGQCDFSLACPGVCRPYVDVSGPCDSKTQFCNPATGTCGSNSTCIAFTHPGLGEACGQTGAYCNRVVAWCDATNHCAPLKTSGACGSSNECGLGYNCAGPQKATMCQPAVSLGGSCTPGYGECQYPGACDASTHSCVERSTNDPCGQINLPETQTCVASSCVYQTVTTGTCLAYRNDGESCGTTSTANCSASSRCRSGTCSPTECP